MPTVRTVVALASSILGIACVTAQGSPAAPVACPAASPSLASAASSSGLATQAIPYDLPRMEDFDSPPPLQLPGSALGQPLAAVLTVSITKDGGLHVNGTRVASQDELTRAAREALSRDPATRAVIQADLAAPWGVVIGVIERLKQGGIAKLAFAVSAQTSTVPPSRPPASPSTPTVRKGTLPEDCADICSIGVRCGLGHVKDRSACDAWCETTSDMGTYACAAQTPQDCDQMMACWKKRPAPANNRRKGDEGRMGPAR